MAVMSAWCVQFTSYTPCEKGDPQKAPRPELFNYELCHNTSLYTLQPRQLEIRESTSGYGEW